MRYPDKRTERIDLRLTHAEKEKLERVAKKSYRSISSLVQEWIAKLEEPSA